MTDTPPTPLPARDYDAIESAVMETERGRWFLSEYAKQNRAADTRILLDAIGRLETVVKRERTIDDVDSLRLELVDMKTAIERTKQEITDLRPENGESVHVNEATAELDAIVEQTESATSDILTAAEAIQELAWTLREQVEEPAPCDTIDNHATEIYTACSFQDLTGQRIKKVVNVLHYLENHVNRMIDIWGFEDIDVDVQNTAKTDSRPDAHLLNGPQLDGNGINQSDVDELFGSIKIESADLEDKSFFEAEAEAEVDWGEADIFAGEPVSSDDFDELPVEPSDEPGGEPTEAEEALDSSWYDEQLSELSDEEAAASAGTDPSADGSANLHKFANSDAGGDAAVIGEIANASDQSDDPTAHLSAGEKLSLFS